ncbi:MAG: YdeI/OmpD-associated family protein [Anaerolineales bacterium]
MLPRRRPRKRPLHPIPAYVRQALRARRLWPRYRARPFYQRNDYVGWITRGVREATRQRRLEQMLEELAAGDRYMKMKYRTRHRS